MSPWAFRTYRTDDTKFHSATTYVTYVRTSALLYARGFRTVKNAPRYFEAAGYTYLRVHTRKSLSLAEAVHCILGPSLSTYISQLARADECNNRTEFDRSA